MPERVVYRETLQPDFRAQPIDVGNGKIIHVEQGRNGSGRIDIWFEVDIHEFNAGNNARNFKIIGTSHVVPEGYTHVGTVVMRDGLVWHIYQEVTT